jgi:membrane associated rhomboid family serine protease
MNDSAELTGPRAGRLIAIQQTLLGRGYKYADGNVENWPMSMALMSLGNDLVLIGPWSPGPSPRMAETFSRFARENPSSGLLMVGEADPESPAVQSFLAATEGCVAYIDALSGRTALRRRKISALSSPPALLTEEGLKQLLSPPSPAAARIDARAELEQSLSALRDAREFHQQARLAGGGRSPVVTMAFMAICIAIFALQYMLANAHQGRLVEAYTNRFDLYGPPVRQGEWWRIITSGFLHANEIHILMNMMAFYYLGRLMEAFQGRWRLAAYFLFTVITGNLASLWWDPTVQSVGASGGLFGLMGAMGAMILCQRRDFPPAIWLSLKKALVTTLMINVVFFFVPYVNGSAHVGGLIGGFLLGLVISRSPTRPKALSHQALTAAALLLAATTVFGSYAVRTIPPGDPPQVSRKQQIVFDLNKWFFPPKKQPATSDTNKNE